MFTHHCTACDKTQLIFPSHHLGDQHRRGHPRRYQSVLVRRLRSLAPRALTVARPAPHPGRRLTKPALRFYPDAPVGKVLFGGFPAGRPTTYPGSAPP